MDQKKIVEELHFIESFIRSTAQEYISCSDQRSTELNVRLRAACQVMSKTVRELNPDKTLKSVQTLNELIPEHDEHLARYQTWFDETIKPRLG